MIATPLVRIRRYRMIYGVFLRCSVRAAVEYRSVFFANVVLSMFWLLWATQIVRVYFTFTPSIGGWAHPDLLVVMGVYFAMNGIRQALFSPNLRQMGEYVRTGTLDYLLLKPIDSQFIVSLRHVDIHHLPDPVLGLGLVAFGYWHGRVAGPAPQTVAVFAAVLAAAFVILYVMSFLLQILAMFTVRTDGLEQILYSVLEAGRFPVTVYGPILQVILTVVVPVAFVVTTPAAVLTGRVGWASAALALGVAAGLVAFSRLGWRWALRRYEGVGS